MNKREKRKTARPASYLEDAVPDPVRDSIIPSRVHQTVPFNPNLPPAAFPSLLEPRPKEHQLSSMWKDGVPPYPVEDYKASLPQLPLGFEDDDYSIDFPNEEELAEIERQGIVYAEEPSGDQPEQSEPTTGYLTLEEIENMLFDHPENAPGGQSEQYEPMTGYHNLDEIENLLFDHPENAPGGQSEQPEHMTGYPELDEIELIGFGYPENASGGQFEQSEQMTEYPNLDEFEGMGFSYPENGSSGQPQYMTSNHPENSSGDKSGNTDLACGYQISQPSPPLVPYGSTGMLTQNFVIDRTETGWALEQFDREHHSYDWERDDGDNEEREELLTNNVASHAVPHALETPQNSPLKEKAFGDMNAAEKEAHMDNMQLLLSRTSPAVENNSVHPWGVMTSPEAYRSIYSAAQSSSIAGGIPMNAPSSGQQNPTSAVFSTGLVIQGFVSPSASIANTGSSFNGTYVNDLPVRSAVKKEKPVSYPPPSMGSSNASPYFMNPYAIDLPVHKAIKTEKTVSFDLPSASSYSMSMSSTGVQKSASATLKMPAKPSAPLGKIVVWRPGVQVGRGAHVFLDVDERGQPIAPYGETAAWRPAAPGNPGIHILLQVPYGQIAVWRPEGMVGEGAHIFVNLDNKNRPIAPHGMKAKYHAGAPGGGGVYVLRDLDSEGNMVPGPASEYSKKRKQPAGEAKTTAEKSSLPATGLGAQTGPAMHSATVLKKKRASGRKKTKAERAAIAAAQAAADSHPAPSMQEAATEDKKTPWHKLKHLSKR